jgi:hypothetical protein
MRDDRWYGMDGYGLICIFALGSIASYSYGMSVPILLLRSYLPLQVKTERGMSTDPQTPDRKQCQRTYPSTEPECNAKIVHILITTQTSTEMPCMQPPSLMQDINAL